MTPEDFSWAQDLSWWPKGTKASINAGYAGHDREIVLVIDGYDWANPIPRIVAEAFEASLPETWYSQNRDTRIEVHPTGRFAGGYAPDDVEQVRLAAEQIGLVVGKVDDVNA